MIRKTDIISAVVNVFFVAKRTANALTTSPPFNTIFTISLNINKTEIYFESHQNTKTAISARISDLKEPFIKLEPLLKKS